MLKAASEIKNFVLMTEFFIGTRAVIFVGEMVIKYTEFKKRNHCFINFTDKSPAFT
jgi:hypothetical protein